MGKTRKVSTRLRDMYRDYKAGVYPVWYERSHLIEDMIDIVEQDEKERDRETKGSDK